MIHIVFISSNYPTGARPYYGTFVQQFVRAMARSGAKCSVISPSSVFDIRYGKLDPKCFVDYTVADNPIKVLRPRYFSFSSKKIIGFNTASFTQITFEKAVFRAIQRLDSPPNMLYGHFLYQSGAAAVRLAPKFGVSSIVSVGEGDFWSVDPFGYERAIKDFRAVNGVISVSSLLKRSLVRQLNIPEEKIAVFPNGVDLSLFYPRNRAEMREKYSLPKDKYIIAFTGHFDEGKGPHRVLKAVSGKNEVGLIFMGKGNIALKDERILFKGAVEIEKVPELLSAADIFVLPTVIEGSCSAIIEAMACGLPVITSRGEFNDDIVDDNVAVRVDPMNIAEIRKAIEKLQANYQLSQEMSERALKKAEDYDINVRAKRVIDFMEEVIRKGNRS